MRGRIAKRRTEAEWAKLIARWRIGGPRVAGYCGRAGINEGTFRWRPWREKQVAGGAPEQIFSKAFVPIQIGLPLLPAHPLTEFAPLEIALLGGRRVLVSGNFDPAILRKLLDVVESSQ